MIKKEEKLIITKIRNGTVIDHIPAGRSLDILNALGLLDDARRRIALIMNIESGKFGSKDLLKIEDARLSERDSGKIAVIAPGSTIDVISNFKVVSKSKAVISDELVSILKCINPNCIVNHENIRTRFRVESRDPLKVRCHYCERVFSEDGVVVEV